MLASEGEYVGDDQPAGDADSKAAMSIRRGKASCGGRWLG